MRAVSIRRTIALCASLLSLTALPATASATSTQAEIDAAVAKAAQYLRSQQDVSTGGIPSFGGDWATTSLAAAGVDAAAVHGPAPGAPSLQDFRLAELTQPTWFEAPPGGTVADHARAVLIAQAAGLDPARLSASSNQPSQLAGRWNPATGSFGEASTYNTAFSIFAMKVAGLPNWALTPTVAFLRRNQHDDGGWTYTPALTPAEQAEASEEDISGAAIGALCEAGVPPYDPAVSAGLEYLRGRLIDSSGGIEYVWGFPVADSPNADTNAWVVSGLNACGIDPQSPAWTTASGKTPVDYLLSLQLESGPNEGAFGYEDDSVANLYATQDALRALAGAVFTAAPPSMRTPPAVAAGTPVPHALALELAPGNVRLCQVTAPVGAPLTQVLAAAEASSIPAGCVRSFTTAGGQVASINGVGPENADEAWLLRLDRGAAALAAQQPVGFGDVVSLRIGENPTKREGATGAAGKAGEPGALGKRGRKGRPGRNAHITCRAHRGKRADKKRIRCSVRKGKRH
jgi:Prenyltransferase and squalene oxidase repeat